MKAPVLIALLTLLPTGLFAGEWARVSGISPDARIRVETAQGKQTGVFLSASDESLRFTPDGGSETLVPRAEVRRVYVRTKSHRVRNAIIGTAVGAAAGVVIYGTLGAWFRNEGRDDTAFMLAAPIGIGAAVGAALPTGSMKKVYDAK